jgi:hypothetical protein
METFWSPTVASPPEVPDEPEVSNVPEINDLSTEKQFSFLSLKPAIKPI